MRSKPSSLPHLPLRAFKLLQVRSHSISHPPYLFRFLSFTISVYFGLVSGIELSWVVWVCNSVELESRNMELNGVSELECTSCMWNEYWIIFFVILWFFTEFSFGALVRMFNDYCLRKLWARGLLCSWGSLCLPMWLSSSRRSTWLESSLAAMSIIQENLIFTRVWLDYRAKSKQAPELLNFLVIWGGWFGSRESSQRGACSLNSLQGWTLCNNGLGRNLWAARRATDEGVHRRQFSRVEFGVFGSCRPLIGWPLIMSTWALSNTNLLWPSLW